MFTIDGQNFASVNVSALSRGFEVKDGGNEGFALSGLHLRDVVGVYLTYTLTIDAALLSPADYDALFEILSAPKDYHTVTFPYGQSTITFEAEITEGGDNLLLSEDTYNTWQDLSITFRSRKPVRK